MICGRMGDGREEGIEGVVLVYKYLLFFTLKNFFITPHLSERPWEACIFVIAQATQNTI